MEKGAALAVARRCVMVRAKDWPKSKRVNGADGAARKISAGKPPEIRSGSVNSHKRNPVRAGSARKRFDALRAFVADFVDIWADPIGGHSVIRR